MAFAGRRRPEDLPGDLVEGRRRMIRPLDVNPSGWREECTPTQRAQGAGGQRGVEGWVAEHEIVGAPAGRVRARRGSPAKPGQRITTDDVSISRAKRRCSLPQSFGDCAVTLDEHRFTRAARERLESEGPTACEQVEHARAFERALKPVEQGFSGSLWRRAQSARSGESNSTSAESPCDDPNLAATATGAAAPGTTLVS